MNLVNKPVIDNSKIIEIVKSSIDDLCEEFKENSTFYFTEKDLVWKFYNIFSSKLGDYIVLDKNGNKHRIFHTEYSTPFRCDMDKSKCKIVSDSDRKIKDNGENGGKFKRGRFDIVILNPLTIQQFSFEEIRSQDY
jgi:hypothetical protein